MKELRCSRRLAIAAVALCLMVATLVGAYLWHQAGSSAESASAAMPSTPAALPAAAVTLRTATTTTLAPTTTTLPPTTATTAPPSTTTTTAPPLFIAAGGDVQGDRGVGAFIDTKGGEAVFAKVSPHLEPAHLAFINLETPISDLGVRKPDKEYTFRSGAGLIDGLTSAGVDMVSLANNHAVDCGPKALLDTIARLDWAGVAHAGAGAERSSAEAPAILLTPAGSVAMLAFTELVPAGFPATSKSPGVNDKTSDREKMRALIADAASRVDFVVVSYHWGTEYTGRETETQRYLAHLAVDAGADLVLGHHPHVIQGLEIYRNRLIAYSLGDFVFDHYSRETGEAFVLQVYIQPEGPPALRVIPVYLNDSTGVPSPVSGEAADVILDRLSRLSKARGLELERVGDQATFGTLPE